MSYTKGPWRTWRGQNDILAVVSGRKSICIVTTMVKDTNEENGNASLISAAPELYETVKAFMEVPGLVDGLPLHIYDMAQKAISKAEVRQDSEI